MFLKSRSISRKYPEVFNYQVLACFLTLVILGFYLATIRHGHNWGDDFSQYIIHAKNIVQGIPYKETGHIINSIYSIAPETYPPVLPFLLAPVYYMVGFDIDILKIVPILCFCGCLLSSYFIFRKYIHPLQAMLIMLVLALNPVFWDYKDWVVSEYTFMLFLYLSFLVILKEDRGAGWLKIISRYLLIGLLMYLVTGTRTIGIVLVPCFVLHEILKRNKVKYWFLFVLLAILVTGLLLLLQKVYLNSTGENYQDQLAHYFSWEVINKNIIRYRDEFIMLWSGNDSGHLGKAILWLLMLGSLAGIIKKLTVNITVLEIFVGVYLAGIYLWPVFQGNRFIMPIIPLFLFYIFYFCSSINFLKVKQVARHFYFSLFALLLVSYCIFQAEYLYGKELGYIEDRAGNREFLTYVRYTPESARFIFDKPRALTLYTGRAAGIAPHCTNRLEDLGDFYKKERISYLALYSFDRSCNYDYVQKYPNFATKVFENTDYVIYKLSFK